MCTGMLWWCGLGPWRGWGQHAWGHGAARAGWGGQAFVPAAAPGDMLVLSTVLMGLPGFLRAMD